MGYLYLLGSVQVVGFFDVDAHLRAGDGPIAALVGGSSCSRGAALQQRTFNDYTKIMSQYRLLTLIVCVMLSDVKLQYLT